MLVVGLALGLGALPACRWLRADERDPDAKAQAEKGRDAKDDGRDAKDDGRDKARPHADRGSDGKAAPIEPVTLDPAQPLSLLFVTWDTTRADHLSLYGYGRQTTPRLDELAAQAVVFDRYIVPMATTLPSHTSLFTGVRPVEHGIIANASVTGERFVPSEKLVPLAAWLRRAGYRTAGFVSATPLKRYSGISAGFEDWSEPDVGDRRGASTVDAAIDWLRAAPTDRPLLQWVHMFDAHAPHVGLDGLGDLFRGDPVAREEIRAADYTGEGERADPKELGRLEQKVNAYDAELHYLDRETARLVEAWRRSGRLARTIVVIVGDHGEGLGQHGHPEHGLTWDEQLHAPCVILAPGVAPRRVPFPVSAHDVLPTLLGLLDLPDEANLLAQVTGHDVLAPDYEPAPVFSRSSLRQVKHGATAEIALTTHQWKVIVPAEGKPQLFDLSADPHEQQNVANRNPDVAEAMAAEARELFKRQRALGEALGAGKTEKMPAELVEELKGMGYLE